MTDFADIDRIVDRYADAVYRKDEAAFLALYTEDVVVFDMWDQWSYVGRDAWAQAVRAWFGSLGEERIAVKFTPTLARVDGDSAFQAMTVRYTALNAVGETLRAMDNRLSWSLRRRDGLWTIAHEHSSAPTSAETLKVSLTAPTG